MTTNEQRVYEELTKYLWDIGVELEEHESDKIAKILTSNTAKDEPCGHHVWQRAPDGEAECADCGFRYPDTDVE